MKFKQDKEFALGCVILLIICIAMIIGSFIVDEAPIVMVGVFIALATGIFVWICLLLSNTITICNDKIIVKRYFKKTQVQFSDIKECVLGRDMTYGAHGCKLCINCNDGKFINISYLMNYKLIGNLLQRIPCEKNKALQSRVSKRFYNLASQYLCERELRKYTVK